MAIFKQLFISTLAIIAAVFNIPSISAVDFIVGDDKGWTSNFDYQAWAQGKEFHVGDRLVFKYPEGAHNVLKVNGTGFQECAAPAGTAALTSGNDVIPLATPGRKWYICGVGQHCEVGPQKLFITVLDKEVSSPSSSPSPAPSQDQPSAATILSSASRFWWMLLIIIGVFFA